MKRGCPEHPKTELLGSALHVRPVEVIGHLELLFHFTTRYAPSGNIGKWPDEVIASRCGWEGDPAVFIRALVEAGWVDLNETHRLVVHDWSDHADDSVHMTLARSAECFADGTRPKLTKLSKHERERIEVEYERRNAHAVRTPCAEMRTDSAEKGMPCALPSQALPSLAIPSQATPCVSSAPRVLTLPPQQPPKQADRFDEFWTLYPNKSGKDPACRAWVSRVTPECEEQVFAGLQRWLNSHQWKVKRMIERPEKWLTERMWQDSPPSVDDLREKSKFEQLLEQA